MSPFFYIFAANHETDFMLWSIWVSYNKYKINITIDKIYYKADWIWIKHPLFHPVVVLIDLSESSSADPDHKPIDMYAIGFEEMVDLDAKNIVNAR